MDRKTFFNILDKVLLVLIPFVSLLLFLIPLQITSSWYDDAHGPVNGFTMLAPTGDLLHWWSKPGAIIGSFIMWNVFLATLTMIVLSLYVLFGNMFKGDFEAPTISKVIVFGSLGISCLYLVAGLLSLVICASFYEPVTFAYIHLIIIGILSLCYFLVKSLKKTLA